MLCLAILAALLVAAAIAYFYRPSETISRSEEVVNNFTGYNPTTRQIVTFQHHWDISANFTYNDALAVGSIINASIVAIAGDDVHTLNNSQWASALSVSLTHAVDLNPQYYKGQVAAADIPLVQDPKDPTLFEGAKQVKFTTPGRDCVKMKEPVLQPNLHLYCLSESDWIVDIAPEQARVDFENGRIGIAVALIVGAAASGILGVILDHKLGDHSQGGASTTDRPGSASPPSHASTRGKKKNPKKAESAERKGNVKQES